MLVVLLSGILSLSLSYLIAYAIWGSQIFTDGSDPSLMNLNFLRLTQTLNQLGFFLLPPLIFAMLSETNPSSFLRLKAPRKNHLMAAVLLILVAGPFTGFLGTLNEQLTLPGWLSGIDHWMRTSEETAMQLNDRFLEPVGYPALLFNILMIGLLPAFGEEFLFRSALIGLLRRMFRGTHLPVILSAVLFSALHLQFFGFLPRFVLGLCLGYLFVWSGSVWVPVTAHFINNTGIIIAVFLYNSGISEIPADDLGTSDSPLMIGLSALLIASALFWVYITRTPVRHAANEPGEEQ